jgi:DNA-binding MarR family transcriptional regulator
MQDHRPPRPRPISRRSNPRPYRAERLSNRESRERRRQQPPITARALADAGRTGSALRRVLRERGIDPKQARLVLLFYGRQQHRVSAIAWALDISVATASRWLDKAERDGLVDKRYNLLDRRGTAATLTRAGVELRQEVERVLAGLPNNERPRGVCWGIRWARPGKHEDEDDDDD